MTIIIPKLLVLPVLATLLVSSISGCTVFSPMEQAQKTVITTPSCGEEKILLTNLTTDWYKQHYQLPNGTACQEDGHV